MTQHPLLFPSLMLGLLLPYLTLSSDVANILDTQTMTEQEQCSQACSNNSACDCYSFLRETCFLLNWSNVSNCRDVPMENLLTEEELKRFFHGNNGTAADSGSPGPVPGSGTPPELQPNSSSSGMTLTSEGSAVNNTNGAPSPSSSLNQTVSTSVESESRAGPSSSTGSALPHLNSSSDSSASSQPATPSPVQQQNPVTPIANAALNTSHQPTTQSPAMIPPVETRPVTSVPPRTTPAGPAMTSTSTSSPAAVVITSSQTAAAATTTTVTTITTTTSTMGVKTTIATRTTAPPTTTTIATLATSTAPKANTFITTTPIPTTTTAVATPTTNTPTTTATTSTATALPDTEKKPSTSALPETLSPTAKTRDPKIPPASTAEAGGKMEDAAGTIIEVAGAPLAKQLVDTAALWAVLLFGLLFFLVTVVLFITQAYESYRRKDYTQVDYLINGMYTDSGV